MNWEIVNLTDCIIWAANPTPTIQFTIYSNEGKYYSELLCRDNQSAYIIIADESLNECKRKCENVFKIIEHANKHPLYVSVETLLQQYKSIEP